MAELIWAERNILFLTIVVKTLVSEPKKEFVSLIRSAEDAVKHQRKPACRSATASFDAKRDCRLKLTRRLFFAAFQSSPLHSAHARSDGHFDAPL